MVSAVRPPVETAEPAPFCRSGPPRAPHLRRGSVDSISLSGGGVRPIASTARTLSEPLQVLQRLACLGRAGRQVSRVRVIVPAQMSRNACSHQGEGGPKNPRIRPNRVSLVTAAVVTTIARTQATAPTRRRAGEHFVLRDGTGAMTLGLGGVALPMKDASGDGYGFEWEDVEVDWSAGETVAVSLVKPAENPLSTDATLSALAVEGAVLAPAFEAGVLVYRAAADAATVTVTARLSPMLSTSSSGGSET